MSRNLYSIEFQEQALIKVRDRGTRSVLDVADDLHMSVGTLRKWIGNSKKAKGQGSDPTVKLPNDLPAQSWGPSQRLQALLETHAMSQTQLHAWCREKGLFEHQLKAWRDAFCSATPSDSRESKAALRDLQAKHETLQRELRRKEKALAEAAALLVLQKKFQALLGDED
jgi:transposase-like protein